MWSVWVIPTYRVYQLYEIFLYNAELHHQPVQGATNNLDDDTGKGCPDVASSLPENTHRDDNILPESTADLESIKYSEVKESISVTDALSLSTCDQADWVEQMGCNAGGFCYGTN